MSSTDMPTEARGFPVRSVLLRHGDWVSDSVWVAHGCLKLFGALLNVMPGDGVWNLADGTPTRTGDGPDLEQFIHGITEINACTVVRADRQYVDLTTHHFDGRIADTAMIGFADRWEWTLHHSDRGAALVGLIDGTPVFILCATTATEG